MGLNTSSNKKQSEDKNITNQIMQLELEHENKIFDILEKYGYEKNNWNAHEKYLISKQQIQDPQYIEDFDL